MKTPKRPKKRPARPGRKAAPATSARGAAAARPKPKPKPRKRAARAGAVRREAVVFSELVFLRAGAKPPFPNNEGDYEIADIVVPGGREPPGLERELTCPGRVVIYASAARFVAACDGTFPSIAVARARAFKAAAKVTCPKDCERQVDEIWHGWDCSPEGAKFYDIAAVEVAVTCKVVT
jgi:hypothetical protein